LALKHILIRDRQLNGWEYGMLRSFEKTILADTGALSADIPEYHFASRYLHHVGQGTNKAAYRRYLPRQSFSPDPADIAWHILMGPENYRLDLFTGWEKKYKTKILYLYDTLPAQYPLIKRLFSGGDWDILITSFNDAVDDLQRLTGRKWHYIPQAADLSIFQPAAFEERAIDFSAYGRRYPALHEILKEFCSNHKLYYDYTTHDGKHPTADAEELYKQYGWHLVHSLFTFSWPVELTNPARAGHLRPITCRWFEAAAAGTIVIGKKPGNPSFDSLFPAGTVIELDPHADKRSLSDQLKIIFDGRSHSFEKIKGFPASKIEEWSWQARVKEILKILA
jgi:hypothetical protein